MSKIDSNQDEIFKIAKENVLRNSSEKPILETIAAASTTTRIDSKNNDNLVEVKGYDFNKAINYDDLLASYRTIGFQATNFAKAVDEINRMIKCKLAPIPEEKLKTSSIQTNCTIFLGYTSNMISSGIRESIRFLVQHKMVDCIVSTAGGIEEDFIKCMAPIYGGEFNLKGAILRNDGLNRIGNLVIPNNHYCKFEDWIMPIFDEMVDEQNKYGINWTPSKIIARLGKEINNEESVYYWAYKNNIPVFSPALTDGSLGDMFFFHAFRKPGLKVDILEDIVAINSISIRSINSGVILLGSGLIKHHILNSNMMRDGADYVVYINTGAEFDGCDGGASPDEAVSWGKIKPDATPVKIFGDATFLFPLILAQTFYKNYPH